MFMVIFRLFFVYFQLVCGSPDTAQEFRGDVNREFTVASVGYRNGRCTNGGCGSVRALNAITKKIEKNAPV